MAYWSVHNNILSNSSDIEGKEKLTMLTPVAPSKPERFAYVSVYVLHFNGAVAEHRVRIDTSDPFQMRQYEAQQEVFLRQLGAYSLQVTMQ